MTVRPPSMQAHGGLVQDELEALGLRAEDVVDFSVSTNPYGPAPAVLQAVQRAAVDVYPDPACTLARRRLGEHLAVPPERLALGNGAADLLWALARALVRPGMVVLMVEPTFSEFRRAAEAAGATLVEWRARAEDDFAVDLAAVAARARECRAEVIYLCTPNVPTGAAVPAAAVAELAAALPGVRLVLDQSFLALSERFADREVGLPDSVVCVRSLTKEHNLPGLRVGYLLAAPSLLAQVAAQRPAWSTSAAAQAAVVAVCEQEEFVAHSRTRLLADRAQLQHDLAARSLAVVPSSANFLLVRVGDAGGLRRRLLAEHRVLVRDCTSFGLPAYVRLGARPAPERLRLLAALGPPR